MLFRVFGAACKIIALEFHEDLFVRKISDSVG